MSFVIQEIDCNSLININYKHLLLFQNRVFVLILNYFWYGWIDTWNFVTSQHYLQYSQSPRQLRWRIDIHAVYDINITISAIPNNSILVIYICIYKPHNNHGLNSSLSQVILIWKSITTQYTLPTSCSFQKACETYDFLWTVTMPFCKEIYHNECLYIGCICDILMSRYNYQRLVITYPCKYIYT